MMWFVLVASGLVESVWATALGASEGFRKKGPTIVFAVGLVLSFVGLAIAMTEIPVGTAYAVWVGIGAGLTALYPVLRGRERMTFARGGLLGLLIACIVGMKLVS